MARWMSNLLGCRIAQKAKRRDEEFVEDFSKMLTCERINFAKLDPLGRHHFLALDEVIFLLERNLKFSIVANATMGAHALSPMEPSFGGVARGLSCSCIQNDQTMT